MPDDKRVLEGVTRLVVDGTNVLFSLRRSASPLPPAALIGRLRAIVPAGVEVVVILDGSPEHGMVSRRVASGVEVRYSGRWTADELITHLAEHEFAIGSAGLLVVTDDNGLTSAVRRVGGRTVRNGWLIDRLGRQRVAAPSIGRPSTPPPDPDDSPGGRGSVGPNARQSSGGSFAGRNARRNSPARPPASTTSAGAGSGAGAASEADASSPGWTPGRGATRKVGNGRKRPSTGR